MSLELNSQTPSGECPVCDGVVRGPADVELSEILYCPDCQSMLVVESLARGRLRLSQAPDMEEDWGE